MSEQIFTLEKAAEEGGEPIITASGKPHSFKMSDVQTHLTALAKNIKAFTSQIELESAKMQNISEHHPIVNELSEQDLFTVGLYAQSKGTVVAFEAKLKETQALFDEYMADIEEIKAQTGIEFEFEAPIFVTPGPMKEGSEVQA